MLRLNHATALFATILLLCACGKQHDEPISKPSIAEVGIARASPLALSDTLEAYGSVGYSPKVLRLVDLPSEVSVQAVHVSVGQAVSAGDALMSVKPTAASLQELRIARTNMQFGRDQLSRTRRLFDQQLATNAELALATQAFQTAQAALESAQARIPGESTRELRAEVSGVVASIDVERGDIVPADTVLVRMADSGRLQVRVGIEPSDLARLKEGQPVQLSPVYDPATTVTGTVASIVAVVDPVTRLAEALVEINDSSKILAGSAVRASIQVGRREGLLGIPRNSVIYTGDRTYAFVVEKSVAKQVQVVVGEDNGESVEVVSGLEAGQVVVAEGAYVLADGMPVSVKESEGNP